MLFLGITTVGAVAFPLGILFKQKTRNLFLLNFHLYKEGSDLCNWSMIKMVAINTCSMCHATGTFEMDVLTVAAFSDNESSLSMS